MAENHQPARIRPRGPAALLLLAAIVAGFYWKLCFTSQYTWIAGDDMASQVLPWLQFQAGEWHKGRFPLWDPSHWAGQPLPGQAQPGAMYPPNWLLFSLPLRDGWIKQAWLHGYFLLIHIAAACFAFLLARKLGASRAGAILAGLVFTLSGWMGQTDWPQMLNSALWAPLVALFLVRFIESGHWRDSLYAGLFLGVCWLGGHHQIPIFLSCACLAFTLWRFIRFPRSAPALVLFWVMAFAAGAAQILPAVEYGREAIRWVGAPEPVGWKDPVPYSVHVQWSLSPAGLLGFILPHAHTHATPFLGFVALSLALLGAIWNWTERAVRGLVLLLLFGVALALVHHTPLHGLLYALLPMVDKARNPTAAVFLCGLAAAPLTALGLSGLAQHRDSIWLRRVSIAGAVIGVFFLAVRLVLIQVMPFPGPGEQRDLQLAAVATAAAILLAVFRSGGIGLPALQAGLVFLALCEYTGHAGTFFPNVSTEPDRIAKLTAMASHGDIAEFLRRQPGLFRVDIDESVVPYNFGDWYGLHQNGGYLASVTSKVYRKGAHNPDVRNLLGVAYRVAAQPDPQFPEMVYQSPSGLSIWRNPAARPRAYSANPADSVRIAAYHPGHVRIAVKMSSPGLVTFAENHYPGWRVSIDGKPAPLAESHGFLLAVEAPAGAHWVEFNYRPASVYFGAALGILALVCTLLPALFPRPLHSETRP